MPVKVLITKGPTNALLCLNSCNRFTFPQTTHKQMGYCPNMMGDFLSLWRCPFFMGTLRLKYWGVCPTYAVPFFRALPLYSLIPPPPGLIPIIRGSPKSGLLGFTICSLGDSAGPWKIRKSWVLQCKPLPHASFQLGALPAVCLAYLVIHGFGLPSCNSSGWLEA